MVEEMLGKIFAFILRTMRSITFPRLWPLLLILCLHACGGGGDSTGAAGGSTAPVTTLPGQG